jgi:phage shock protein A
MTRSLLSRLGGLVRADEDDVLAGAGDPDAAVAERLAELTASIAEVEAAVVRSVGDLRLLEGERATAQREVHEWTGKAAAAAGRSVQLRTSDPAGAVRFDELARVALRRQLEAEQLTAQLDDRIATQSELVDRLREGLATIRAKREQLVARRTELRGRGRLADTQMQVRRAVEEARGGEGPAHLDGMENDVVRREALAQAFEELDAVAPVPGARPAVAAPDESEVERRLQSLTGSD